MSSNKNDSKYKEYRKNNYVTPYGINLVSQMIKHQNEILIDNYCHQRKISEKKKKLLKSELLKVSNYTPQVIQSKHKEQLQKHLLQ